MYIIHPQAVQSIFCRGCFTILFKKGEWASKWQAIMRRGWLSTLPMAATVNTQYLMPPQYPSILGLFLWAILGVAVLSAIVFSCVDGKERRSGRKKRPSAWTGRAYDIGNAGGHHGGGTGGDGGRGSDGGYLDGGGG